MKDSEVWFDDNKSTNSMPGSMNMELEHGATSLMVDGKVSVEKVMEHGESELGETIDTTIYKSRELKVVHPLHPQHALNLLTRSPNTRHFICDECGDISDGFLYFCCECHFKVDVKCAGLSAPSNQGQRQKEMARKTKISHFSHDHMLVLGSAKKDYYCSYCQLEIFGLAYCCLDCNDIYVLHESCLEFPEKMQHPFHPLHPLMAKMFLTESCHACDFRFVGISYSCLECDLHLHPTCLNSMRRAQKFNLRTCKLDFFYFGIEVLSWPVPRIRNKSVELEDEIEDLVH
ncbi:DC1 - like 10 [Theobroma cacao]|nr:DC1 - like 10 [Theobroma cacao]